MPSRHVPLSQTVPAANTQRCPFGCPTHVSLGVSTVGLAVGGGVALVAALVVRVVVITIVLGTVLSGAFVFGTVFATDVLDVVVFATVMGFAVVAVVVGFVGAIVVVVAVRVVEHTSHLPHAAGQNIVLTDAILQDGSAGDRGQLVWSEAAQHCLTHCLHVLHTSGHAVRVNMSEHRGSDAVAGHLL